MSYKGAFGDSLADGDMWLAGWSWLVAQDKLSQRSSGGGGNGDDELEDDELEAQDEPSSGGGGNDDDKLAPWVITLIIVASVLNVALIGAMFVMGKKLGINIGVKKAKDDNRSGNDNNPIDIRVHPDIETARPVARPIMAIEMSGKNSDGKLQAEA